MTHLGPLLELHAVLAQTETALSRPAQPWHTVQDLEIERLRGEWSRLTDDDDMSSPLFVDEGRQLTQWPIRMGGNEELVRTVNEVAK